MDLPRLWVFEEGAPRFGSQEICLSRLGSGSLEKIPHWGASGSRATWLKTWKSIPGVILAPVACSPHSTPSLGVTGR